MKASIASIVAVLALSLSSSAVWAGPMQATGIDVSQEKLLKSVHAGHAGDGIKRRTRLILVSDPPPIGRPAGNRFYRAPETSISGGGRDCNLITVEYRTSVMPFSLIRRRCATAVYRCEIRTNHLLLPVFRYTARLNLGCTFG